MPLESEDQRHLTAAIGYCELKMYVQADAELDEITPDVRHLPEVVEARLCVYLGLKHWDLMEEVARKLVKYNPEDSQWWISWATATRYAESIEAARAILLDAIKRHPKVAVIAYNLACYESQLGDLASAKEYIKRAFVLDEGCRMMALDDADLKPLWDSMQTKLF